MKDSTVIFLTIFGIGALGLGAYYLSRQPAQKSSEGSSTNDALLLQALSSQRDPVVVQGGGGESSGDIWDAAATFGREIF